MKLRVKVLLILAVTLTALISIFYITTRLVILHQHEQLERIDTMRKMRRLINAINDEVRDLDKFNFDWAAWDDTYTFVEDRNAEYIDSNFVDETFVGIQLNLIACMNAAGEIVLAKTYDLEEREVVVLTPDERAFLTENPRAIQHISTDSKKAGITMLPKGPFMFSSRPILTSQNEGPIRGTLVMGRYITPHHINQWINKTELPISMFFLNDPNLPSHIKQVERRFKDMMPSLIWNEPPIIVNPDSEKDISAYCLLFDPENKPVLIMRTKLPRTIYLNGLTTLHYVTLYTLTVGILFGLFMLWLLDKLVLSRLTVLTNEISHIGKSGEISERLTVSGSDELAILGAAINKMLSELELAGEEVRHSEKLYRTFLDGFQGIAYRTNIDGHPIFFRGAVERITGYSAQEIQAGAPHWKHLIHEDDVRRLRHTEKAVRTQANYACERDYRIRRQDGSIAWLHEMLTNICDRDGTPLFIQGTLYDITARKQAEDQLKESRRELRKLSEHLQEVKEEESRRIARRIHDELGQLLMSLKIDVSWLRKHAAPGETLLHEKTVAMSALIDTITDTVQNISLELRPSVLDTLGLNAAIDWQIREFEKRTNITCMLNTEIDDDIQIGKHGQTAIFRIIQEALTNVARHARAREITLTLEIIEHILHVTIQDNGIGIPEEKLADFNSFGLIQMRERAVSCGGTIDITAMAPTGTRIVVRIPLDEPLTYQETKE
ncbi:MAG: PAS domain S-box protein [Spartobacteria bacterium]|nr:PAS domain S-box protein [Spartobacteria bacterium]